MDVVWDDAIEHQRERLALNNEILIEAARTAASLRGYSSGHIGVRITDDPTIHQINAQFLSHDYPTDVISFPYSDSSESIEGELVASIDTAIANAADPELELPAIWDASHELVLYVIHGVLHIGGMDDHDDQDREAMRKSEREVLSRLGIEIADVSVEATQP